MQQVFQVAAGRQGPIEASYLVGLLSTSTFSRHRQNCHDHAVDEDALIAPQLAPTMYCTTL